MIDVQQAIRAARESLVALYPETEIKDLMLEEVELTDDGKYWHITLGFTVPAAEPLAVGRLAQSLGASLPRYERKYKLFRVDTQDGQVKAMKIRTI